VRGLAGKLATGEASVRLEEALANPGLVGRCGLAGGAVAAFKAGLLVSSPRNFSSFLSLMAARIQVIQMGRAARAPVSLSPSD
jgi:hypothetical protein